MTDEGNIKIINLDGNPIINTVELKSKLESSKFFTDTKKRENKIRSINSRLKYLVKKEKRKLFGSECFESMRLTANTGEELNEELSKFNGLLPKNYSVGLNYLFNSPNNTTFTIFRDCCHGLALDESRKLILCMYYNGDCISSITLKAKRSSDGVKIASFSGDPDTTIEISIDSRTRDDSEGRGLNKILRAICICISKILFSEARYVVSRAINIASVSTMIKYFNAKILHHEVVEEGGRKIFKRYFDNNDLYLAGNSNLNKNLSELMETGVSPVTAVLLDEDNISKAMDTFKREIVKLREKPPPGTEVLRAPVAATDSASGAGAEAGASRDKGGDAGASGAGAAATDSASSSVGDSASGAGAGAGAGASRDKGGATGAAGEEDVSITFNHNRIGLRFEPARDKIIVNGIKPGGPASSFPEIKEGMILSEVADQPIKGMSFDEVMTKISDSHRPLNMKFEHPKNLDGGGKKTRRKKTRGKKTRRKKTRRKKIRGKITRRKKTRIVN
jgi:hypothetical protein